MRATLAALLLAVAHAAGMRGLVLRDAYRAGPGWRVVPAAAG